MKIKWVTMKPKPFYFIGNIFETDIKTPILLKFGFRIKKADLNQIKVIKYLFENAYRATQIIDINVNPYETIFIKEGEKGCFRLEYPRNAEKWNYWVLEFNCDVDEYEEHKESIIKQQKIIDLALLISDYNIQLLWGFFHYSVKKDDVIINSYFPGNYRPLNFFKGSKLFTPIVTKIHSNFRNEINQFVIQIEQVFNDQKYIYLQKIFNELSSYFEIPPKSPYRIIGLFSILEYLLTSFDEERSINKQLQSKLNLLNNRFSEKMKVCDYFKISDGFSFTKIIEKLYTYRSDIAHGNPIDFEKKLQVLNNIDIVEAFLLTLVKRTIKQSLFEPDLIIDLKTC